LGDFQNIKEGQKNLEIIHTDENSGPKAKLILSQVPSFFRLLVCSVAGREGGKISSYLFIVAINFKKLRNI
jgi:hypothetical protein